MARTAAKLLHTHMAALHRPCRGPPPPAVPPRLPADSGRECRPLAALPLCLDVAARHSNRHGAADGRGRRRGDWLCHCPGVPAAVRAGAAALRVQACCVPAECSMVPGSTALREDALVHSLYTARHGVPPPWACSSPPRTPATRWLRWHGLQPSAESVAVLACGFLSFYVANSPAQVGGMSSGMDAALGCTATGRLSAGAYL